MAKTSNSQEQLLRLIGALVIKAGGEVTLIHGDETEGSGSYGAPFEMDILVADNGQDVTLTAKVAPDSEGEVAKGE